MYQSEMYKEQPEQTPTVDEVKKRLLDYSNGRVRPSTYTFYESRLNPFVAKLGRKLICDLTTEDIEGFVGTLLKTECRYEDHPLRRPEKGTLSHKYVQGFERAIRRLLYFAVKRHWLPSDENPWLDYEPIDTKRPFPKCAREDDLPALFLATAGDSPYNIRDRAIVSLFIDTGIRRGGVANLQMGEIDLADRKIYPEEKTDRSVYHLTPRAADALAAWLAIRPKTNHDFVFTSLRQDKKEKRYARLKERGVEAVLRHLKEKTGISGAANPHAFRHGYARGMLRRRVGLKAVSQLLNHSGVAITADIYGDFEQTELKTIHDRFSPLNDVPDEAWFSNNGDDDDVEIQ